MNRCCLEIKKASATLVRPILITCSTQLNVNLFIIVIMSLLLDPSFVHESLFCFIHWSVDLPQYFSLENMESRTYSIFSSFLNTFYAYVTISLSIALSILSFTSLVICLHIFIPYSFILPKYLLFTSSKL